MKIWHYPRSSGNWTRTLAYIVAQWLQGKETMLISNTRSTMPLDRVRKPQDERKDTRWTK
jgi:hypothetical protein